MAHRVCFRRDRNPAVRLTFAREPSMKNLCCMTFLGKDNQFILAAGCQKIMYKIDADRGQIVEAIPTDSEYTILKNCRYICAATNLGSIEFLDPLNLQVIKKWQAHTSKINCMDAKTEFLVTCGWSNRPFGPPQLDALAKVFDLKKLEQLPPMPFPTGAAFAQIHPKMSTTSVLGSHNGQVQIVDLMNPNGATIMFHVPVTRSMTLMAMSPSGSAWAIADQDNAIHLWGSPEKLQFAETFNPTEFADPAARVRPIAVDEDLYVDCPIVELLTKITYFV